MEISMNSITALFNLFSYQQSTNFQGGIFHFVHIKTVCINGTGDFPSTFTRNTGSVVVAVSSDIYLDGNVQFIGNYGSNGAAISLYQESSLYFAQGANILFEKNTAQLSGGAIYSPTSGNQCPLQPYPIPENLSNVSSHANITFINNQATSTGNSIFATYMYSCKMHGEHAYVNPAQWHDLYNNMFTFIDNPGNGLRNYTTNPAYIGPCCKSNQEQTNQVFTYPGQQFNTSISVHDMVGNPVRSTVYISEKSTEPHTNSNSCSSFNWQFPDSQQVQMLSENSSCTEFNITILTSNANNVTGILVFSVEYTQIAFEQNVSLLECPFGFELNTPPGACECAGVLKNLPQKGYEISC